MDGQKHEYKISTPDVDSLQQATDIFDSNFNKSQLIKILSTLKPLFDEFNITQLWMGQTEKLNKTFEELLKKTFKRSDYLSFISRFFADPSNRSLYFNSFQPELLTVWREIKHNYYISSKRISQLLGKECIISSNKSYYYGYSRDEVYIPETSWFTAITSNGWSHRETSFSLSPLMRKYLLPFIPNNTNGQDDNLDKLPEGFTVFNGEKDTLIAIPLARNLFINGSIMMGKTKLPSTTVKKTGKILNLAEFFPHSEEKEDKEIRTRFFLTAFALYGTNSLIRTRTSAMSQTSYEMVREILPHIMYYSHHLTHLILPMLNKIYTNFTQASNVSRLFKEVKNALLTLDNNNNRWHSYESVENIIRENENNEILCTYVKPKLMEDYGIYNTRSGDLISPSNIYANVGKPFIKGIIFTLASIGLVEIAYKPADDEAPSPYDGLGYIRLTALGRYALGLQETYSLNTEEKKDELFELSDEKLIIRSLSEVNPYESALTDIANPIGNNRYAVTTSSFLRNCTSVGNINQKISIFRQLISPKPPENWEAFFKQLIEKSGKINKCSDVYTIYEIDHTDYRLHEIIATDPTIKKITRRAENYLLLIESGKFAIFRERLKSYGYMV